MIVLRLVIKRVYGTIDFVKLACSVKVQVISWTDPFKIMFVPVLQDVQKYHWFKLHHLCCCNVGVVCRRNIVVMITLRVSALRIRIS